MRSFVAITCLSFWGCSAGLESGRFTSAAAEAGPLLSGPDSGTDQPVDGPDAGGGQRGAPDASHGHGDTSSSAVFDGGYDLRDHSDHHPCAQLCRRPQREVCGLDFLGDPSDCVPTCMGRLGQMTPSAQQAWLRCGLERCQAGEPVDCHPAHFMGPVSSQACLNAALLRQRCEPHRYEPLWRDVWECESLRSPTDQPFLGGGAMVNCMAQEEACGFAGFYQCLVRSRDQLERGEDIRRLCAQADRCGAEQGGQCLMSLVGLTPATGEQRVLEVSRCLERAGGHCPDIERCLAPRDGLAHRLPPGDPCRQACGGCGEDAERCVEHCMALRLSLGVGQGLEFSQCLSGSHCDEGWPLARCLERVLPQTVHDCRGFEAELSARCGASGTEVMVGSAQDRHLSCLLSGLRSGVMTGEELNECVNRVGCVDDPVGRCLRGGAH